MRIIMLIALLAALISGCQAKPASQAAAPGTPAVIASLTDETVVWSCPQCGMDFNGPGKCTMCHVDLVKTDVAYICPADDKPVERTGKCPRCDANAKVVKTAVAGAAPADAAAPSGGAATGS